MRNARPRLSRTDLVVLALLPIATALAAFTSDAEFFAARRWWAATNMATVKTTGAEASLSRAIQDFEAVLYAISPILAFIAYRPRRGAGQPRRRGPGHVALAIAGGFVAYALFGLAWAHAAPASWTGYVPSAMPGSPTIFWTYLPTGLGEVISRAIAAGWIYLAVIGGWRTADVPLERAGRWLGAGWIVAGVASWGVTFLV